MTVADDAAIRKRQSPLLRIALVAAVIILAVVTLRTIVRHKLSEAFFQDAAIPTAFVVNPRDGMIGGYLAWMFQRTGHGQIAAPIARRALAETPLSAPALGTLVLADPRSDPRLLGFAAGAGWRDSSLQIWLAQSELDRGDVARAADHIDAAARIDGVTGAVRALIDRMADAPASLEAMARRIAVRPVWRAHYFVDLVPTVGSIEARGKLMRAVAGTSAPPDPVEIQALVNETANSAGLPAGYDLWRSLVPAVTANPVSDPDFQRASDDQQNYFPFGWMIRTPAGVSTETVTDGRGALHVTSDGNTAGGIAIQMLRVTPGRHRLVVGARYGESGAQAAFRWNVTCWGDRRPTTMLSPVAGASATGSADFTFDVPADGSCPIVAVSLLAQPAARPGEAEAWFNDVRIE